jgi:hypothetical protein
VGDGKWGGVVSTKGLQLCSGVFCDERKKSFGEVHIPQQAMDGYDHGIERTTNLKNINVELNNDNSNQQTISNLS